MAKSKKASAGKKATARTPAKKAAVKAPAKAVAKAARGTPVKSARARAVSRPAPKRPASKPAAKTASPKTAPKSAAAKSAVVKVATAKAAPTPKAAPKPVAPLATAKPAPAKPAPTRRKAGDFVVNDYVVYPTHGVGRIRSIEEQEIAGLSLTLFVVEFEKEKMTLRVPIAKANATGMRKLSSPDKMKSALQTLKGRARVKRTMWSRRAQEYEAKINSGDPVSIAEVVRDLHRASGQPEQSYSERQIYENALDRLARELAAVEGLDETQATDRLDKVLKAA
jgi:CarD family transcriptional regulator